MTPPNVIDFLATFRGHSLLRKCEILMLQEIIVDAGIKFDEGEEWVLISGKKRTSGEVLQLLFVTFSHSQATVHPRAVSVTLSRNGHQLGTLCGHIPHHATVVETATLLADWERARSWAQHRFVIGMDANEVFLPGEDPKFTF